MIIICLFSNKSFKLTICIDKYLTSNEVMSFILGIKLLANCTSLATSFATLSLKATCCNIRVTKDRNSAESSARYNLT